MGSHRRRVLAFVALQLSVPLVGLGLRWFSDVEITRWAWHMFSTTP